MTTPQDPTGNDKELQGKVVAPRLLLVDTKAYMDLTLQSVAAAEKHTNRSFGCELLCSPTELNPLMLDEIASYIIDPANKIDGVITGRGYGDPGLALATLLKIKYGFKGPVLVQQGGTVKEEDRHEAKLSHADGIYSRSSVYSGSDDNFMTAAHNAITESRGR